MILVMIMKKTLISISLAVVVGIALGIYAFNKIDFDANDNYVSAISISDQVYAIQVGVFENIDNANKLAEKYGGLVVVDENKYRVYIDIVSSILSDIKNYYDKQGISYYVKTIDVSDNFASKLKDYEELIKAASIDNYDEIIKQILKEYEKELT